MLPGQAFQHLDIGGIAGLGFPPLGQPQLGKEDLAELAGGVDVELLSGQGIDGLFQILQLAAEILGQPLQLVLVHGDAGLFHVDQNGDQRHLQVGEKLPEAKRFELRPEPLPEQKGPGHILAGIVLGRFRGHVGKAVRPFVARSDLAEGGQPLAEHLQAQVVELLGTAGRVEEVGGDHGVPQGGIEREAVVFQDGQIEFEVVAELGQVRVGKKRGQDFLDQGQG